MILDGDLGMTKARTLNGLSLPRTSMRQGNHRPVSRPVSLSPLGSAAVAAPSPFAILWRLRPSVAMRAYGHPAERREVKCQLEIWKGAEHQQEGDRQRLTGNAGHCRFRQVGLLRCVWRAARGVAAMPISGGLVVQHNTIQWAGTSSRD